jgi:hypothetical protein
MPKKVLFIVIGTIIHFSLIFLVIVNRIGCEVQPNCVSEANTIAGDILGFPMNVITWVLYPNGAKANGWFYILVLLNSLFAVTLLWYVLIRFIERSNKVSR